MEMICAHCDRQTSGGEVCVHCGETPILQGRYELEEVVGEGASGTTYRAWDEDEERTVAIKEMGIHGIETFKAHELFEREADVLCRLEHSGIPTFYDYFEWGAGKALRFYLVMEFVEGETLLEDLDGRQYTVDGARDVIWQLAEIARYLHGLSPPVLHRDIKPSNVLRRPGGELVLIDFGSVRDALEADTSGSTIAGTIGYMAPEQLRGQATPASDVYGIGATAIHLLTRREPTELLGPTNRLEWEDHVDLPGSMAQVMGRMLAMDPAERISDGDALMKALVEADAEDEAPAMRRAPDSEHPWGGVPAERSQARPVRQSTGEEATAPTPEMSTDDTGNFKASMIMLLVGVSVMGVLCGAWLTVSTGPVDADSASETQFGDPLDFGTDDESEFAPELLQEEGLMDLDELLHQPETRGAEGGEEDGVDTAGEAIEDPAGALQDVHDDQEPVESLSRQDILSVMGSHYEAVQECDDGSVASGHLTVRFEIGESGDVEWSEVQDDDASERFERCVIEVFEAIEFPPALQSQPVTFPIPLR